jgi:hypothetical protein
MLDEAPHIPKEPILLRLYRTIGLLPGQQKCFSGNTRATFRKLKDAQKNMSPIFRKHLSATNDVFMNAANL